MLESALIPRLFPMPPPLGAAGLHLSELPSPPELGARWVSVRPVIRAYLIAATGSAEEAEELLAKVALATVAQAGRFDSAKPFAPWAMGIAKIEVLRHRRDQARGKLRFGEAALTALETALAKAAPEADARLAALAACLQTISGKAKEAVRLAYTEGLSGAQAAKKMGIEQGHFFVLLSRARSALRHCIENRMASSSDSGSSSDFNVDLPSAAPATRPS